MVGILALQVVHTMKLPEHTEKIGLPMPQMAKDHLTGSPQGTEAQVFAIQDGLGLDEFGIKLLERQSGREHGVLDIEEPVVKQGELPGFRMPGFGAGIRCVDGKITISGTLAAHSWIKRNCASSQSGSTIMLMATMTPS